MSTRIYEKTDKGREEIATRAHPMSPRLRTLLVMIDGRQPLAALLPHFAKLGLDAGGIEELVNAGYIRAVPAVAAAPEPVAAPRVPPGLRRAHKLHQGGVQLSQLELVSVDGVIDVAPEPAKAAVVPPAVLASMDAVAAEQFKAVHKFYNETIRVNLGLRGFGLQLKVERADTLDDLRALRQPYLDAVKKIMGHETAQALEARLSTLLAAPDSAAPASR